MSVSQGQEGLNMDLTEIENAFYALSGYDDGLATEETRREKATL